MTTATLFKLSKIIGNTFYLLSLLVIKKTLKNIIGRRTADLAEMKRPALKLLLSTFWSC